MPQTLEFRITSDLKQNIQPITCNFEELKAALIAEMAQYKGLVIQEEDLPFAKESRAKINKISKAISEQRLMVKKQVLSPFELFEAQCKELDGICKEASESLDVQIKQFEEVRKAEKKARIESFFLASVPEDMANYLRFADVFNSRWLNATFDEKNAQEEIQAAIQKCQDELAAIRETGSQFVNSMLGHYKSNHNLAAALRHGSELERLAKAEQERKEREEAERKRRQEEEEKRQQQAKLEQIEAEIPVEVIPETPEETAEQVKAALEGKQVEVKPKLYTFRLEITGDKNSLVALKEQIVKLGLRWKRLDD